MGIATHKNLHTTVVSQSDNSVRFDDRVAIVTGAGSGLGRAHALLLASRGAKVVVNDLGGSTKGEGGSASAADSVVEEIKALGGIAVASYDSVEAGDKVVDVAMQNFGRIDILINNAGILRDKTVTRISDLDWDLVHRVHLRGSFLLSRAAWPHMKQAKYGRIVMTSSTSGIFGNFGQANYGAAKLGLVGLSNTLALEGARSGIHCNAIVPTAASRMTEDILPPDMLSAMAPGLISPVVAWLCHEDCTDTGNVVEASAGWAGKYRWQRSRGAVLMDKPGEEVTMERVAERWGKVGNMEVPDHPASHMEATMAFLKRIEDHLVNPSKAEEPVDPIETKAEATEDAASGSSDEIDNVFESMEPLLDESIVNSTQAVFMYDVTGEGGGKWFLDLKNGAGSWGKGEPATKADCTLTLAKEDFVKMFTGKLKPATAFMGGKLKLKGDMGKAMALEKLMNKMK